MDHKNAAKEVLAAVGGKDNIVSAAHCATRLRLVIADNSKLDKAKVEDCEGVKGVFEASGQIQIIYGTGTVNKVYDEFVALAGVAAGSKDDVKQAAASKANPFQRAIKSLGDVFVPIIPAIVASGLLMGLTEGIDNAMGNALQLNSWWILIHTFSNASFVFLQILIGFSAARVFGGNEFLGGVIGMIMNHTSLINAWSIPGAAGGYQLVGSQSAADWLTSVTGKAVDAAGATANAIINAGGIPQVQLFGIYNVTLQGYQGHVIPVVIAVFIMCMLEKWLHKHVPDMLDLFVTPLVTVLVTGTLTLTVIGPVFSFIENLVMIGFQHLLAIPFGLGGALVGAIYPATVVLGVHHMFNALEATLIANTGVDNFNPIISCCNVAQGAACLAVFVKTRSMKKKELALPSGISGFLGITEPAIYGVNLPNMKPFIAAMIGGAVGGALVSVLGVVSIAYGITGIFGFLITTGHTVPYAICIVVAAVIAFGIAWVLYKDPEPEAPKTEAAPVEKAAEPEAAEAGEKPEAEPVAAEAEPKFVASPMAGKVLPLEEVPDQVFSAKIMGEGFAIDPADGRVVSPIDGTISVFFPTKHAIGIAGDNGVEVLVHIGMDTVGLEGAPFVAHVEQGDHVSAGQLLVEADLDAIRDAGLPVITPVIVTNTDAYSKFAMNAGATVEAGSDVLGIDTDEAPGAEAAGEALVVASPMTGMVLPLENVPDQVFSAKLMGDGFAVYPADGRVVSPIDGTVSVLFPTKHAIGIAGDNGVELLIHIGMDTVSLDGAPFVAHVEQGDKISAGQLLVDADFDQIRAAGLPVITPVIVTNTDAYKEFKVEAGREAKAGEAVLELR